MEDCIIKNTGYESELTEPNNNEEEIKKPEVHTMSKADAKTRGFYLQIIVCLLILGSTLVLKGIGHPYANKIKAALSKQVTLEEVNVFIDSFQETVLGHK